MVAAGEPSTRVTDPCTSTWSTVAIWPSGAGTPTVPTGICRSASIESTAEASTWSVGLRRSCRRRARRSPSAGRPARCGSRWRPAPWSGRAAMRLVGIDRRPRPAGASAARSLSTLVEPSSVGQVGDDARRWRLDVAAVLAADDDWKPPPPPNACCSSTATVKPSVATGSSAVVDLLASWRPGRRRRPAGR